MDYKFDEEEKRRMGKELAKEVLSEIRLYIAIAFLLGCVSGWFIGLIV